MAQCLTGAKVLQSAAVDFSILCQCTERQPFVRAATVSGSLSFLPAQYQTALNISILAKNGPPVYGAGHSCRQEW